LTALKGGQQNGTYVEPQVTGAVYAHHETKAESTMMAKTPMAIPTPATMADAMTNARDAFRAFTATMPRTPAMHGATPPQYEPPFNVPNAVKVL